MSGLAAQRIAQLQAELTEAHAAAAAAAQAAQEGQEQLVSQQDTAARELERVRAEAATSVRQAAEHTARQLESVRCAFELSQVRAVLNLATHPFRCYIAAQHARVLPCLSGRRGTQQKRVHGRC